MNKEELIEFLKENLKVSIKLRNKNKNFYTDRIVAEVKLILNEEVISSAIDDIVIDK